MACRQEIVVAHHKPGRSEGVLYLELLASALESLVNGKVTLWSFDEPAGGDPPRARAGLVLVLAPGGHYEAARVTLEGRVEIVLGPIPPPVLALHMARLSGECDGGQLTLLYRPARRFRERHERWLRRAEGLARRKGANVTLRPLSEGIPNSGCVGVLSITPSRVEERLWSMLGPGRVVGGSLLPWSLDLILWWVAGALLL